MKFDLKKYIRDCQQQVNQLLEDKIPSHLVYPEKLHESMRYSLFAGGKRIRPVLCLAAADACGARPSEALVVACALEMIHTFSLIHDDLPAMDDDDLRRGVPTNHIVFGEALAILAGDALVTQAFHSLGQLKEKCDPSKVLEIITDIAEATGCLGMIGGQVIDMQSEGKKIDIEQLKKLHALKTGRLITVSVTSGAKLVTDDSMKIKALRNYGEYAGLAFQIADDILDIEGGEELGKPQGSDVANDKATYPSLLGLDGAKQELQRVYELALASIDIFGPEADPLREIAKYIVQRNH